MTSTNEPQDAVQVLRRGQEHAAAEAIAAGHAELPVVPALLSQR